MRAYRIDYFQFSRDSLERDRAQRVGPLLPSFTLSPLVLFNSRLSCLSPSPVALFRESSVFRGLIARASCPPFELRADRI